MIRRVVEAFVDVKMNRADISIALDQVAPDVGVLVIHAESASPADKAELLPGDILLGVDDQNFGHHGPASLVFRLELRVLNLLADGFSNPKIARVLSISRNTVKFHVSSIISKLGAASRTEAVTIGVKRGLIIL